MKITLEQAAAWKADLIRQEHFTDLGTQITGNSDPHNPMLDRTAEELTRQASVPPERLARYDWLREFPDLRLRGWNGIVQEVRETPEGLLAHITISPLLSSLEYGHAKVGHLEEFYRRTDAGWIYIGGKPGEMWYPGVVTYH